MMNVMEIENSVNSFIKKHKSSFYMAGMAQTKALELGAAVGVSEHYKSNGYQLTIQNPQKDPDHFIVKTSTKGYPWNFSKIILEKGNVVCEVHMNLTVRSAHDEGIYCVDVGIVNPDVIPLEKTKEKWLCIENDDLITFSEVKKLAVYPMLLAQFIGIVHEIKPRFIRGHTPKGFVKNKHLFPALISLGTFSGNSKKIVEAFPSRKIRVEICENFDVRIAKLRGQATSTPFYKAGHNEI